MWTSVILILALWHVHGVSSSVMPESGLEKAAAASAVVAGSDSSSQQQQQQQTDLETRLKRITDTLHRVRGPDMDSSDGRHSERLVIADRPPSSFQAGAAQTPFMVRNDEFGSSGDGALGDDDEGDDGNGELGSGDDDISESDDVMVRGGLIEPDTSRFKVQHRPPAVVTEGVYPADVDEFTTKKPVPSTTTRRSQGGRVASAGPTRKPYIESEHRHPTTKSSRPTGSSSSHRTLSVASQWLRSLASICVSLFVFRILDRR